MVLHNGREPAVFKMKGESSTLRNFVNTQSCQQHSCEVLLFDEAYRYCSMELNIGMTFDRAVPEAEVICEESEDGVVLYPGARDHRSCRPLPEEWIEMVNNGEGRCMEETVEQPAPLANNLNHKKCRYKIGSPKEGHREESRVE